MLSCLTVRDLALFTTASFSPGQGFCALTGQTGAGKSLLVDALAFVAGHRKGREIIRAGSDKCEVRALFSPVSRQRREALAALGVETGEDGIEFCRTLSADGRGTCRINGALTTLTVLKAAAGLFLDIHEQEDSHALLDPSSHLYYLDAFAGDTLREEKDEYHAAYDRYRTLKGEFEKLYSADRQEEKQRRAFLEYQIGELRAAKPVPGEYEKLTEEKTKLENARRLSEAAAAAKSALSGEGGAYDLVMRASDALSGLGGIVPDWEKTAKRLEEMGYELSELAASVTGEGEEDPAAALDRIEERLNTYRRLFHLYAPTGEGLVTLLYEKEEELAALDRANTEARRLHAEAKAARDAAAEIALKLREKRKAASALLEEAITAELAALDMPGVRFSVSMVPAEKLTPEGTDKIEFFIGTNVGQPPAPLCKIASGGELSRILLALRCVLSDLDEIDTLVFDEIDTGVSGKSAAKIGRSMKRLAARRQVLAVTHSAQVAAHAHAQLKVEKVVVGDRTEATVFPLSYEGRAEELARILGGERITQTALANAKELLREGEKE